jgi:mono/diheme cytochrome c family protein
MLAVVGLLLAAGAAGFVIGRESAEEDGGPAPTAPATTAAEAGDAAAGAEVFASAGCGGCHVYGPAGSTAEVGPSLDATALDAEQVATIVADGRGGMPAFGDQLDAEEIADVAAYVTEG